MPLIAEKHFAGVDVLSPDTNPRLVPTLRAGADPLLKLGKPALK
jgi:hypothetical protein